MSETRKIITNQDDGGEWYAYREGNNDGPPIMGSGPTKELAIRDLLDEEALEEGENE